MNHSEELERLSVLHRNGDLTDEEFAAEKKRLIEAHESPPANNVIVNTPPNKSSGGVSKGCGIGCLGVIAILVIGRIFGGSNSSSSGTAPAPVRDERRDAYIGAEVIVDHYLKAPSSSDYPYSGDANITKNADGSYTIYSYVDAQNSFGAKIRTHFLITVRGSGDNWTADAPPTFDAVE